MKHFTHPKFWANYEKLPKDIQNLADRNFELLKQNQSHPSLHFKKVGRFWSVRVGLKYRAIAVESAHGCIWFWIGSHADYDKMIGGK